MVIFANSQDQDEMPHLAVRVSTISLDNQSVGKEIHYVFRNLETEPP